jgi:hypothetical protein
MQCNWIVRFQNSLVFEGLIDRREIRARPGIVPRVPSIEYTTYVGKPDE